MKYKHVKKLKKITIIPILTVSILASNIQILFAQQTIFERNEVTNLAKDVTFTRSIRVTDRGLLDVYVLKAPIGADHISIRPSGSIVEHGLRETPTKILGDNGAIAGVNGDFFSMSGTHSAPTGPMVSQGNILSAGMVNNMHGNRYAAFFIDDEGVPFIKYPRIVLSFENNGYQSISVFEYNKLTNMQYSGFIDSNAMYDTELVNRKFNNVTSVVVEDGKITHISEKGELVQVPQNGFVIVIPEHSAEGFTKLLNVGETAEMVVRGNVDLNRMETAIGGAGTVLINGEVSNDGGFVPGGLQPRTAVGFNQDGTQAIMMVVDGRSHSVGATHQDMANLMLEYGAYNAMHLDGGASSAMGVQKKHQNTMHLVNTVPGGNQRRVTNTLGIFNESVAGEFQSVFISSNAYIVFNNTGVPLYTVGVDGHFNPVHVNRDLITHTVAKGTGEIINDVFFPTEAGAVEIIANLEDTSSTKLFHVVPIAELTPNTASITAGIGGRVPLHFTGKSRHGKEAHISTGVRYEVFPPELGIVENDVFIAKNGGAGYIRASVDDVVTHINVNVSNVRTPATSFENDFQVSFRGYPANVTGSVLPQNFREQYTAAQITYQFLNKPEAQSAYMVFDTPIALNSNTTGFNVWVKGDESNNLLRARLTDATGATANVVLAQTLYFEDYRQLTVSIPEGLQHPVMLERIYVTATNNQYEYARSLYIGDITINEFVKFENVQTPPNTVFRDHKRSYINNEVSSGFDITVVGDINAHGSNRPSNYADIIQREITRAEQNSNMILFAGEATGVPSSNVPNIRWGVNYAMHSYQNVSILQMSARNGGLINTNISQWGRFKEDIIQSGNQNVIIMIDRSPLNFTVPQERDLFIAALEDLSKMGKNIFVVSTEGSGTTSTLKNGVRYINMGGLFRNDGTVNNDFGVLRFRVDGDTIRYDIQR
jgi:exopolysaccharide biosynthesis protein